MTTEEPCDAQCSELDQTTAVAATVRHRTQQRRASALDATEMHREQGSKTIGQSFDCRPHYRGSSTTSSFSVGQSPVTPTRSCLRGGGDSPSQAVRFALPMVGDEDGSTSSTASIGPCELVHLPIVPDDRAGCLKNSAQLDMIPPVMGGPETSFADSSLMECETAEISERSLNHEGSFSTPPSSGKPRDSTTSRIRQRRRSRQEGYDARFRSPLTKVILMTVRPVLAGLRSALDMLFL
ncbi:hypothetical protein J8273_0348 [Carpediemonas membranifera]|uniref:Uncharacterized protein n=1 Tax=Carpediemonas membranifera TaxID=201153 RepID=A0A8J6B846_9EUKA|nr:hypothetical protein J8273_0348 [Carpediemonas membranifera]|eukprot:KAG9395129.1 hypothetical protein J8273_0348 [Carpediemonas membranifera]